jgi:integrase
VTNPFERPGISKGPGRKEDPPLTENDLAKLHDGCAVLGKYADAFRGWIDFQAFVGCRPAEGLGIERDTHIDLDKGLVEIVRQKYRTGKFGLPKNGKPRTVLLPEPAEKALVLIPTRVDSPWLFYNKTGGELLYATMLGDWHKVCTAAGLAAGQDERYPEGVHPYHLRHFCGSHLGDLGTDPKDIAHQLGHTDGGKLAMELYIHTYYERALDRLRAAYRQQAKPVQLDQKRAAASQG